jgi:hypothetical protein
LEEPRMSKEKHARPDDDAAAKWAARLERPLSPAAADASIRRPADPQPEPPKIKGALARLSKKK